MNLFAVFFVEGKKSGLVSDGKEEIVLFVKLCSSRAVQRKTLLYTLRWNYIFSLLCREIVEKQGESVIQTYKSKKQEWTRETDRQTVKYIYIERERDIVRGRERNCWETVWISHTNIQFEKK